MKSVCNLLFFVMSALLKLEKLLSNSPNQEVQVQIIVEITSILSNNSFPDVVHGCLRLLSSLFYTCTNYMRQLIVKTLALVEHFDFQTSSSFEEVQTFIIDSLAQVIESNDPIARGFALQALSCLSSMFHARDDVQFQVLERLESTHSFEAHSALICVKKVAAMSESHAEAVLQRASKILHGSGGDAFKVSLLEVLGCLTHSVSLAKRSRTCILSFIEEVPKESFVYVGLSSSSLISQTCFTGLPEQVDVVWRHFMSDPRPKIRLQCLRCLFRLAKNGVLLGADFRCSSLLKMLEQKESAFLHPAILAVLAMICRQDWKVDHDTKNAAKFLRSKDQRSRCWSLRFLLGAAMEFASPAALLFKYLEDGMKREDFALRSVFLSACLALCSKKVSSHSPDMPQKMISMLLKGCKGAKASHAFALLHTVSVAVCSAKPSAKVKQEICETSAKLAESTESSPLAFAAAIIAYLRSVDDSVTELDKLSYAIKLASARSSESAEWRWALYCVAKESSVLGYHLHSIYAHLASFPAMLRFNKWLLMLSEMGKAESDISRLAHFVNAVCAFKRAQGLLLSCASHAIQKGSTLSSTQTVSRSSSMQFQKLFVDWKTRLLESSLFRKDCWTRLADDARNMCRMFPDMDGRSELFLRNASAVCFFIANGMPPFSEVFVEGGGALLGDQNDLMGRLKHLVTQNNGKNLDVREVRFALLLSLSKIPRYFFRTQPKISAQLSIVKPKSPQDMSEFQELSLPDTTHVFTVDGVIITNNGKKMAEEEEEKTAFNGKRFKRAEVEVSIFWTSEKTSLIARLLACETDVRQRRANLMSKKTYSSQSLAGNSFSVVILCTFEAPKNEHVLRFVVSLIDENDVKWSNIALETIPCAQLLDK